MTHTRINALKHQGSCEVTFDDVIVTPDGGVDFHPDLTTHISGPQWARLYDGMAFALRRGWVMNVHVTVVWHRLGVRDNNAAGERLEDFCAVLRKRAAKRELPCAYAYAHERTRDEDLHTHLLTLWPYCDRAGFEEWVKAYLRDHVARVVALDPLAVKVRHERDDQVARHWLWFGYISKGIHPDEGIQDVVNPCMLRRFGDMMLRAPRYEGVVRCRKRVGVSRNIDIAARQRAGFVSPFQRGASRKDELYGSECFDAHKAELAARHLVF